MPASIQINIVWVSAGHGASASTVISPDKAVTYVGKAISVGDHEIGLSEQCRDGDYPR